VRIRRLTRAEWLVAGLIAALLGLLALPALATTRWVGSTDLEVEFVATDATTGQPVPGAEVEVWSGGGFYEEREPREFRLAADPDGRAAYVCRGSMCFGTSSLFTDTYCVHLPHWWFRVSAPGYEATEPIDLDVLEYRRAVRKVGPRGAKLVVPVSLRKV
jgi:hypothetical protein